MSATQNPSGPKTEAQKGQPSPAPDAGSYKEWGEVGNSKPSFKKGNGDKPQIEHLTLTEGTTYRIRLVHKPYQFFRHFEVLRATSPGFQQDVAWQAGHTPRERYAILILDRNDQNKLKILEAGPAVFNEFKNYFELKHKDPGGKEGPDWMIQIKIPTRTKDGKTFKDKRQTQYKVIPDEAAPFTAEEAKYIKDNWVELKDIKKPTDSELIKEMLEYAKTRSDTDPIPGSNEWWKERREKRQGTEQASGNSGKGAPMASSEPDENAETASPEKTAPSTTGDGYNSLFEEEGDKEKAVKF